MDRAIQYNRRTDESSVNAVSWVSYLSMGSTRQLEALANALEVSRLGQPIPGQLAVLRPVRRAA